MSKVFIEEETLIGIGNAIREKSGTTDLIATTDMATAISNLPTGGGELKYASLSGTHNYSGKTYTYNLTPYVSDTNTVIIYMTYTSQTYAIRIENGVLSDMYEASNGVFFNRISTSSNNKISYADGILTQGYANTTYAPGKITIFYVE